MAGARRVTVEFLGDAKRFDATADHVERKSAGLGSKMARVGKVAAAGLGAGLLVAGVAAFKFGKAAAEDQQQAALLAKQLKNSAHATDGQVAATERWISKQGVAKGVADDQLRPALMNLVRATGSVSKAQKLASLAMDVSAGTGKDLGAVSMALAKAQNGNVGALSRLGIATKDAHGKTLSFTDATKKMADQFGGAATTKANTLQGKIDRLKLIMSETAEAIGYKLLPIATKLAGWLLNLVKGFQSGQGAGAKFKEIFAKIGDVIRPIGDWIGNDLVPFIKDLGHRFNEAMGGTAGFKKSMGDLKPTITVVKEVLRVLWEGLKIAIKVILPVIVQHFKLLTQSLGIAGKTVIWLWNNAFQPTLKFILRGIGWVIDKIADMLGALGKVPGFGWAKDAADKLHEAAKQAGKFAQGIKDIPSSKEVKIKVKYSSNNGPGSAGNGYDLTHKNGRHRAMGGPVTAGMPYIVGENRPELFVPSQSGRIVPRVPAGSRGGGDVHIHINGVVDKQGAAREVRKVLLDLKRTVGPLGLA